MKKNVASGVLKVGLVWGVVMGVSVSAMWASSLQDLEDVTKSRSDHASSHSESRPSDRLQQLEESLKRPRKAAPPKVEPHDQDHHRHRHRPGRRHHHRKKRYHKHRHHYRYPVRSEVHHHYVYGEGRESDNSVADRSQPDTRGLYGAAERDDVLERRMNSRLGRFSLRYGRSLNFETDLIQGQQVEFDFRFPYGFGFSFRNQTLVEGDFPLASNRYMVNWTKNWFPSQFSDGIRLGLRAGLHTLEGQSISSGFAFGGSLSYHDLDSFYSFHLLYDGTLFNGANGYEPIVMSQFESFLRLYMNPVHTDIGGRIEFSDIENDNQVYQAFVRVGVSL